MDSKKPQKLINLLNELIITDASNLQQVYLNISKEILKTDFKTIGENHFGHLIVPRYIQLATKEYVYSSRSKDSEKSLLELISIIEDFEIL